MSAEKLPLGLSQSFYERVWRRRDIARARADERAEIVVRLRNLYGMFQNYYPHAAEHVRDLIEDLEK